MKNTIRATNKYQILLWIFILAYIVYFSWFTILRYRTLYASYFDLGIMHQTVFNTYRAISTGDWTRFLEQTDPFGPAQIKRMAIHNDILLAFLAPFYFLNNTPATLLIIQTIVLGLGAYAVFKITQTVFEKSRHKNILSLVFAISYLLYPPMQRANLFEFHAVTLATAFLLFMFYFWLKKRYGWSFLFLMLSLLSKENVALTTLFFGIYVLYSSRKKYSFPLMVILISTLWFIASIFIIIPYFRGGEHFALKYYGDLSDNPTNVAFSSLFRADTYSYLLWIFGPLGFLSFFSPLQLLIAFPEFAINLLSNNANQRMIIYHYTAILQPFVFIAAIYGLKRLVNYKTMSVFIISITLIFAYLKGPLPFSKEKEIHPIAYPQKEMGEARIWSKTLKDEKIKISTTGHLAPLFSSRRYFYNFSKYYKGTDYVVIQPKEVYNSPEKKVLIPAYQQLILDPNYRIIYQKENFEVYKKIYD